MLIERPATHKSVPGISFINSDCSYQSLSSIMQVNLKEDETTLANF